LRRRVDDSDGLVREQLVETDDLGRLGHLIHVGPPGRIALVEPVTGRLAGDVRHPGGGDGLEIVIWFPALRHDLLLPL
jgi:hypothetical protein